ncbi:hypothetical protein OJF2_28900 [Aquisphaera giovannonii]|uniref:Methyltransferase domain protein n=1 Tax=Aquisphaera giovannonii TaxID=406548 RepID=A0A5B9W1B9_9BACT|nr:class I SAM-dependent methyltransferase [Aquisphaera giovannonii]QEH34353.1 hypothetical protein OJF2_28900 [Aquisphaera giovannonii]
MKYDSEFFSGHLAESLRSARAVVPYVVSLLSPQSVIDLGCGVGTWLRAFEEQGVTSFLGLDGDYVDLDALEIPRDRFLPRDLTRPTGVTDRFDLAMSLEVAEHLPPEWAPHFVDELVGLSDAVLFSAAIPSQGGTNHINEQWQSYWRDLFVERGYRPVDCLRPRFWSDPNVTPWYRQNAFLYLKKSLLERRPDLQAEAERLSVIPFDCVHPELFESVLELRERSRPRPNLRTVVGDLPRAIKDSVEWRLGKLADRKKR